MSLDINLTGVEATANKSTNVNTDQASNTKYPSVKAVYDWAVGLFATASSVTTSLATKYNTYFAQFTTVSPTDNNNYYFSSIAAVANTTANRLFYFDKTETLKQVNMTLSQSVNGSNETVTLYLRNVTTGTDHTVGTFTSDFGATTSRGFNFTGLSIAVNATDEWTWKLSTPTWGTNPTGWNVGLFARTI